MCMHVYVCVYARMCAVCVCVSCVYVEHLKRCKTSISAFSLSIYFVALLAHGSNCLLLFCRFCRFCQTSFWLGCQMLLKLNSSETLLYWSVLRGGLQLIPSTFLNVSDGYGTSCPPPWLSSVSSKLRFGPWASETACFLLAESGATCQNMVLQLPHESWEMFVWLFS